MDLQNILFNVKNNIATVVFNRPDKLNALNQHTIEELSLVTKEITSNTKLKGVVLTGSGEKAFIAGADIAEINNLDLDSGRQFALGGQRVLNRLESLNIPVIAAVNGFALGGGCEVAMACHLRFASPHAKFGQPEVNLGIIPGFGGTQRLPRLVGKGRALQLLFSGQIIDAQEAHRIGLVNKVCQPAELLSECEQYLNMVAEKGPLAISTLINTVNEGLDLDLPAALSLEADKFAETCATADMKEGTSAFLEKRKANFSGR